MVGLGMCLVIRKIRSKPTQYHNSVKLLVILFDGREFKLQRSGTVPGVGMVHAPFALLPMPFPESHWQQACELTPIFNELVDLVSLDGKFLQEALSRFSLSLSLLRNCVCVQIN